MQKPIEVPSAIQKTMVTLYINLPSVSWNEVSKLLRSLERTFKTEAISTTSGNRLIWQILVNEFDPLFWKKIADGNEFEVYTHQVNKHW